MFTYCDSQNINIIMIFRNIPEDRTSSTTDTDVYRRPKGARMIGGVHVSYLLWVYIPLLVSACLYSYH
jgi:hypothetical protein